MELSKRVDTSVANFNNVLSSADTTVQKALDTLDDNALNITLGDSRYVNVTGDTMTGNLVISNNTKIVLGASTDLEAYSNGTDNYLTASNGADVNITANTSTGEDGSIITLSGGLTDDVETYQSGYVRIGNAAWANPGAGGLSPVAGSTTEDLMINGALGVNGITNFRNVIQLNTGTTAIAPLYFVSGTLKTSPFAGGLEFLTDKLYFTITTGSARKEIALADIALTSGRMPYLTTNGRLTDSSGHTYDGSTMTTKNLVLTGTATFGGQITVNDGINFALSAITGTKFGLATTQKMGFYNASPIAQPGATTDLGTVLSNLGLRASGTAYPITTSGAVNFTGGFTIATTGMTITNVNIALGTTTGTKIGTSTTQKIGFYNATPVVQQTDGAGLTNNVTSGGATDTIANYTDLVIYANDAAAIRNDIYQLARKIKIIGDALRTYGLLS